MEPVNYRPSGNVDGPAFLVLSLLCLLGAASFGVGSGMLLVEQREIVIQLALTLLPALALAWLIHITITEGRCRNYGVAVLLGLTAAFIFWVASFYLQLVSEQGFARWLVFDELPDYVSRRFTNDQLQNRGRALWQPITPLAYALEIMMVVVLTVLTAMHQVRKPFCETCGRWHIAEAIRWSPGAARTLAAALDAGTIADWMARPPERGVSDREPHAHVVVDYCPDMARCHGPVYLSLSESDGKWASSIWSRREARTQDLLAALSLFPSMQAGLEGASEPRLADADLGSSTPTGSSAAVVESVPAPYRGRMQRLEVFVMVKIISSLVMLVPFFFPFVVFGLTGLVLFPVLPQEIGIGAMVMLGLLGIYFLYYWQARGPKLSFYLASLYERKMVRQELRERPATYFNCEHPAAILIEIIYRQNWSPLRNAEPNDIGLLLLDHKSRTLLFEGNRERFSIPVEAIHACQPETILEVPQDRIMALVIVARVGQRDREFPVLVSAVHHHFGGLDGLGSNLETCAYELKRQIEALAVAK